MRYTIPDNMPVPEPTDLIAPLEDRLGDLAIAVQAALLRPGLVANAAARDAAFPAPTSGQSVWRLDVGWREVYLTTPTVRVNGWYPVDGALPLVTARAPATQLVVTGATSNLKFTAADALRGISYNVSTGVATCTQPGLYGVTGSARFATGDPTKLRLQVMVNGATDAINGSSTIIGTTVGTEVLLAVNDTITVAAANETASNVNLSQANRAFAVSYRSPA